MFSITEHGGLPSLFDTHIHTQTRKYFVAQPLFENKIKTQATRRQNETALKDDDKICLAVQLANHISVVSNWSSL